MFGLDGGGAVVLLFLVGGYLLPFFINAVLASSRGKSVVLMLLLTAIFSWIVTLILAMLPRATRTVQAPTAASEPTFLND